MKIKRLISLILVMMLMFSTMTTNVFALDGCDGTLKTGEIELESYIEWNSFKSKLEGVSSTVLDELRTAEKRGHLPEIFPIGTSKFIIKTDLGFYLFNRLSDGSYSYLDDFHFARLDGTDEGYVGTGTVVDGECNKVGRGDYCCDISKLIDYGFYGDNFFIIAKARSTYSCDYMADAALATGCSVSTSSVQSGPCIWMVSSTGSSFEMMAHTLGSNGSDGSYSTYYGTDSVFFTTESYDRRGNNEDVVVVEFSFSNPKKALAHTSHIVANVSSSTGTATSVGGRFATADDTYISVDKDAMYPYALTKAGDDDSDEDYESYATFATTYAEDDDGTRKYKPVAGFISLHDKATTSIPRYFYRYSSSSALYNGTGRTMKMPTDAMTESQKSQYLTRLKEHCSDNGIPFYGYWQWDRYGSRGDTLTLASSRGTQTDASGNTYHDGVLKLYKPCRPLLDSDGKYTLNVTKDFYVGGGLKSNTSQLTFENLSLGADANIKVYGVPASGSEVLLETITNSKNSLGTYTTGKYKYGLLHIVWTAGTSTSGRGEGFKVTDVKFGETGASDAETTYVDFGKVHCPHIGFSGLVDAKYPTVSSSTSSKTYDVSYSNLGNYRAYVLMESGVSIENGTSIKFTNKGTTNTSTSYNAYNYDCKLQFKNSSGTYTVTSASNSHYGTFTGPSGTYDVYGYVYSTGSYYQFTASFTSKKYTGYTKTETKSIASKSTAPAITDKFTSKHTSTHTYASANPEGVQYVSLGTYTLNKGDTIVTSCVNGSGNSRFNYNYLPIYYKTSGSTSYSSMQAYDNYYIYTGNTATVELFVYHQYYSKASYKWKDGDYITINIYPAILRASKALKGSDFTSTSKKYLCNTAEDTSFRYRVVYYDSKQYSGSNYSYCYIYINGTRYYPDTNDVTAYITSDDRDYSGYYYLYNANYKPDASADLGTIYVYDTVASYMYNGTKTLGTISWSAPTVSGYTYKSTDVTYNLEFSSTYGYYGVNTLNLTYLNNGGKTATVKNNYTTANGSVKIYGKAGGNLKVTANIVHYYYDNAGTSVKRYTPASTQTLNFKIAAPDSQFMNVIIKDYNLPSGMTLTIDGTKITSSTTQTGWKNNNVLTATLTIPGDGVHGQYFVKAVPDVIKYELQTKRISDKTRYSSSNTSANLCRVAVSYNQNDGATITSGTGTISGTDNAYVKIVPSSRLSTSDNSDRHQGCNGTITGIRGISTISTGTSDYRQCTFDENMGYWPTSASSVTLELTPSYSTYKNNCYAPSGYGISKYYIVKHTDIPDSKIRTYTYDDTNVYLGENITIGAGVIAAAKTAGGTVYGYTSTPVSSSNTGYYSSSNNYRSTYSAGKLYAVNSAGTETALSKGYFNHANTSYTKYRPSNEGSWTTLGSSMTSTNNPDQLYGIHYRYSVLNEPFQNGEGGNNISGHSYNSSSKFSSVINYSVVSGYKVKSNPTVTMTSDATYSKFTSSANPMKVTPKFAMTDWAGALQFEDGRYGKAVLATDVYYSAWYTSLQRIDVYRKYTNGKIANLASVPVSGTSTFFKSASGLGEVDEEPPVVYHTGNDFMYVANTDSRSQSSATTGTSLAWLRTGHWHLKGDQSEIEGIAPGGVQNPVKSMETDDADTEIVVSELDMNAESWQMGHNIKDGKVTDQKLSDDVRAKINEINLGTITVIKGDGDQVKFVPVGSNGEYTSALNGVNITYDSSKNITLRVVGENQVRMTVLTSLIGNKNTGGSTAGSLSTGQYIFTGEADVDGVDVPVVLQVNVIDRPTTSGKTTITLTD